MRPVCLSIAGSDPSGGAGIQADLKTFHRHGVYGAAAISLVTVQNSMGTKSVYTLDASLVRAQVEAVLDDLPVACVKTGALGNGAILEVVAQVLSGRTLPLVVDPVLAAKNGSPLLDAGALDAARRRLFPLATLLTPNLDEASILLGREVRTVPAMREAARDLRRLCGCRAVLVKGGHLEGGDLVDVLCDPEGLAEFASPRIETPHTRGTGCTYAAAIAAHLAWNLPLREAVSRARRWMQDAIADAVPLGAGRGGLDHFA